MAVRVIWPTFGKSRKTNKSYPSAGDQFCESRKTAKFDAPVGLLGRVSRTGSNNTTLSRGSPMAVLVSLPTFVKSRKPTKSDPSTGDQLGKREFMFKPVSTKFRAVPCRAVP